MTDLPYHFFSTLQHSVKYRVDTTNTEGVLLESDIVIPAAHPNICKIFRSVEHLQPVIRSVKISDKVITLISEPKYTFEAPKTPIILSPNTILIVSEITGACMKELGYETINAMFRTEGIIVVCPYTGVSKANVDGTCISSIRDEHGQPFITCSWIQYLP